MLHAPHSGASTNRVSNSGACAVCAAPAARAAEAHSAQDGGLGGDALCGGLGGVHADVNLPVYAPPHAAYVPASQTGSAHAHADAADTAHAAISVNHADNRPPH